MRRFECVEGTVSKFWEVEQVDADLNIRWGRIDTQGQRQTKSFADAAKAAAALTRLVNEKARKGYSQTSATASSAPVQAPAAKKASHRATRRAAPASVDGVALAPGRSPTAPMPPAKLDQEAATAFEAIRQAVLAGDLKQGDFLSLVALRRRTGVSDKAAKIVLQELHALGILDNWPGQVADRAVTVAERVGADHLAAAPAHLPGMVEGVAPWQCGVAPVRITAAHRAAVYASRRFPASLPEIDPAAAWTSFRTSIKLAFNEAASDASLVPVMRTLLQRMEEQAPVPDRAADGLLLAWFASSVHPGLDMYAELLHWLVAQHGLEATVVMFLDAQHLQCEDQYDSQGRLHRVSVHRRVDDVMGSTWHGPLYNVPGWLRQQLSAAPDRVWQACVQHIRERLPQVAPCRQPPLALLVPDVPDLSHSVLLPPGGPGVVPETAHWLLSVATDPAAIAAALRLRGDALWSNERLVATLLVERGVEAVPLLAPGARHEAAGEALARIGVPDAIHALARAAHTSKPALARLALAVNRWPHAALVGLAGVAAAGGKDAGLVTPTLVELLRSLGDDVVPLLAWIEPAGQAVIDRLRSLLRGPSVVAAASELPPVLAAPPWRQSRVQQVLLTLALPMLPVEPVEAWAPGSREAALKQQEWLTEQMHGRRLDPRRAAHEIGFVMHGKRLAPLNPPAAAAIAARDTERLIVLWREMIAVRRTARHYWFCLYPNHLEALPDGMAAPFWNAVAGETDTGSISRTIALHGLAVLPALIAMVRSTPADCLPDALYIGAVELALPAARALVKGKTMHNLGRQWLLAFPEHAAAGLLPAAVGKTGEARNCAGMGLRLLVAHGHEALVRQVAHRYANPQVMQALQQVLDDDPMYRYPTRRAKLPGFWAPSGWRRPLLSNGKAVGDDALQVIGEMLTFPTNNGVYPGIAQVQAACQPDSLAEFGWDLFGAWLNAGAPAKENWALSAQGLLGNDDTARRLTPFIRAWPGEAAHARAVSGLDVLATIGTDVALMQINGIAQKIKFKGLQDKAREKIAAIAEARQLTPEELDDRLAPDLGLDEHGALRLDFGPRAFKVGFDEALRPYVRAVLEAGEGPRLNDLPKPKKSDDAELSKASVERFKALKKDVRTIASQQVLRLELAMCARRRWTPALFRSFLVEHPLLRHLVQRLVWGVYAVAAGDTHGGQLQACFRVAEDGSCTDANDDAFALPDGQHIHIGVPHALELPAADATAFGQLLADYELLQPFAQIDRDTYTLRPEECDQNALLRWQGINVPTGRVLGLANKGWRRGMAEDGGGIGYFTKPLANGKVIELLLDPGLIVGIVDAYPEQELGKVQFGTAVKWGAMQQADALSGLDAITASELIRDMEALRA